MAKEWCYRVFGQEFGPIELDELKEQASSGLIGPNDLVRCGHADWVVASELNVLTFARPATKPVAPGDAAMTTRPTPGVALTPQTDLDQTRLAQAQLAQAQAKYSTAEQSAKLQVAWALAPNVDPTWWASIAGVGYGPVPFTTVFEWTVQGRLSPTDLIKNGYYGACVPAANVPGLFTAATTLAQARTELIAAQETAKSSTPVHVTSAPAAANAPAAIPASSTKVEKPAATTMVTPASPTPAPVAAATLHKQASAPVISPPETATRQPERNVVCALRPTSASTQLSPARPAVRPVRSKPAKASSGHSFMELARTRWIGGGGIAALALVAVLFMGSRSSARDIERFHDLKQILEEVRTARATGTKDFASLKTKARKLAETYAADLKKEANNAYPAKQALLFAVRDEMPRMIDGDLSTVSQSEKNFELRLKDAAATLGID